MPSASPSQSTHLDHSVPSVKNLASSDPSIRRKNLTAIISHLEARNSTSPLSSDQSLALWRGFSVALYMHDSKNALSVQNLIFTLAGTIRIMLDHDREFINTQIRDTKSRNQSKRSKRRTNDSESPHDTGIDESTNLEFPWTTTWCTAFWQTMSKEWNSFDQWRINKYLLLIRLVLREVFTSMSPHDAGQEKETNEDSEAQDVAATDKISSSPDQTQKKGKRQTPAENDSNLQSQPHGERKRKKQKPTGDAEEQVDHDESAISTSTADTTHSPLSLHPQHQQQQRLIATHLSLLSTYPLNPTNRTIPDGLRLHVLDVWLDEIAHANLSDDAAEQLIELVRTVAKGGVSIGPSVKKRAKEVLGEYEDRKMEMSEQQAEDDSEDQELEEDGDGDGADEEWRGIIDDKED